MKTHLHHRLRQGFTLVELLIVVAVVAVLLVIAAPSVRDMIELQRLRGVNAQFVTDVQFTRTEAASRQEVTGISFESDANGSCYIVHTCGTTPAPNCKCDCTAVEGSRCAPPLREIRTVILASNSAVKLTPVPVPVGAGSATPDRIMFDPSTGAMSTYYMTGVVLTPTLLPGEFRAEAALTRGNSPPRLRTIISPAGRPSVCAPGGLVSGERPC